MKVSLPEIEPGLEGTLIGKIRLFMRVFKVADRRPAEFLAALERVGLEVNHKADEKP